MISETYSSNSFPAKPLVETDMPNPYDLEININSILGFLKGWDIVYSNDGKKRYEFAKRNRTKIFSVIGNKNKGKSFILSKISEIKIPSGHSISTKGLSIFFPDNFTVI